MAVDPSIIPAFDSKRFESFIIELLQLDCAREERLAKKKIELAKIDPFSAALECATLGLTFDEWISQNEVRRVRQKSLQNNIGSLHEEAIACFDGWELSDSTADVVNHDRKIIAEIKNKFNTMNSSSSLATYTKLEQLVDGKYEGYQSYVVQIIPKPSSKPYCKPFTPSNASRKMAKRSAEREDIKVIDGEGFYTIVGDGNPDTLDFVHTELLKVLQKHSKFPTELGSSQNGLGAVLQAIKPSLR